MNGPAPSPSEREPSARERLRQMGAGELSSRELTERTLARLDAAKDLNAVVAIRPEEALAAAEEADRERAAGAGSPGKVLLGLPVTIKDSLDVAGWPTTSGIVAAKDHLAERDASAVGRLRAAGAIVVAKSNVPEASSDVESDNALWGRTVNPLDPERTPGGSSGGEGALLGADASLVGVGVDGGCSIRLPSHYCGTVGLRATAGRIPETGLWPPTRATGMYDLACVGPMARYVEDLELMLGMMAGADGIDPFAPPAPLPSLRDDGSPLRVAHYTADPLTVPTAATVEAVARAAAALGGSEEIAPPPGVETATDIVFDAISADGGAHLREAVGDGPHVERFQNFLDEALPAEPPSSVEAFHRAERLFALRAAVRAHLTAYDVVICPVAPGPAPRHGEIPAEGAGGSAEGYGWLNFASTYSAAGLPVAVVPAGEENGLPIGVQIVSRPFREDLALTAASRIEAALGG
jgi:amidase